MDQSALVASGQALIRALDDAGLSPRLAVWVHNSETDSWKLWIVPPKQMTDKREFYKKVAEIIAKDRVSIGGIDVSDTQMVQDTHPAVQGIGRFIHFPGVGSVTFAGNRFNNFYLPDSIILRSNLT